MDIRLSIYKAGGRHKLTVVARPRKAALLGEYVLMEAVVMDGCDDSENAQELLAEAYDMVGRQLRSRGVR